MPGAEAEDGRRAEDDSSCRTMRGQMGGGGKVLKIRTGDGTIRLKAS